MIRLSVKQEMAHRKLARQFITQTKAIGAKHVLVTSVQNLDGKTILSKILVRELKKIGEHSYDLFTFDELKADFEPDQMMVKTIVDGPAYYDPDGLTAIPERWMQTFDAALISVAVRKTDVSELAELIDWLRQYGFKHIWPILNYMEDPLSKIKKPSKKSTLKNDENVIEALKEGIR